MELHGSNGMAANVRRLGVSSGKPVRLSGKLIKC